MTKYLRFISVLLLMAGILSAEKFTLTTIDASFTGCSDMVICDLNFDTFNDIVAVSSTLDQICWWENDGSGNFTKHVVDSNFDGAISVDVGDLDDDGDLDIVAAGHDCNEISAWENNYSLGSPDITWTKHVLLSAFEEANSVKCAFFSDHVCDIIASSNSQVKKLQSYEPYGFYFDIYVCEHEFHNAKYIDAADMNGDGNIDFVVLEESTQMYWFKNYKDDFIENTLALNDWSENFLYLADINLDNTIDIVNTNDFARAFSIRFNPGDPETQDWEIITYQDETLSQPITSACSSADLDEDGDMDIVTVGLNFIDIWTNESGSYGPCHISSDISAAAVAISDLNEDGKNDILVGGDKLMWYKNSNNCLTHTIQENVGPIESMAMYQSYDDIALASGSEGLIFDWSDNSAFGGYNTIQSSISFNDAKCIFPVDYDQNGDLSYIAASEDLNEIAIYSPTIDDFGCITFNKRCCSNEFTDAYAVSSADFNNNGMYDIVACGNNGKVYLWERIDSLNTISHIISTSIYGANSVTPVDADNDGDMDIIVSAFRGTGGPYLNPEGLLLAPPEPAACGEGLILFENDGHMNFNYTVIDNEALGVSSVSVADMNGDGYSDIVAAAYYNDQILLWKHSGESEYTKSVVSSNFDGAYSTSIVDYNGDGNLDILCSAYDGNKVSWLESNDNSSSSFTEHIVDDSAENPIGLNSRDMDNDGDMDIICGLDAEEKVVWYEQESAPTGSATISTYSNYYPIPVQGEPNQAIGKFKLTGSSTSSFISVRIKLEDFRQDISNFKLWESADDIFDPESDSQLASPITCDPGINNSIYFDHFTSSLSPCGKFYFLSCDLGNNSGGYITSIISNEQCMQISNAALNTFTNAALIGEDVPLPVELTSFSAAEDKGTVILTWETATEIENLGFVLQKKFSAETVWTNLASYSSCDDLQGHGNCSEANAYSYTDDQVQAECAYTYRLGQLSYADNGEICWIGETEITTSAMDMDEEFEFGLSEAYPNPFNPSIHISYGIHEAGWAELNVLDLCGKTITRLAGRDHSAGNYDLDWSPQNLSAGIYLLQLNSIRETSLQKILYVK